MLQIIHLWKKANKKFNAVIKLIYFMYQYLKLKKNIEDTIKKSYIIQTLWIII